ncbi:hypothetical protein HanRHA438_Chr12g0540871 [Helianthus annuus]|nr:hypothetical protein HanRHA438_Chr12g0540871 [Helianthus annuus]
MNVKHINKIHNQVKAHLLLNSNSPFPNLNPNIHLTLHVITTRSSHRFTNGWRNPNPFTNNPNRHLLRLQASDLHLNLSIKPNHHRNTLLTLQIRFQTATILHTPPVRRHNRPQPRNILLRHHECRNRSVTDIHSVRVNRNRNRIKTERYLLVRVSGGYGEVKLRV